MADHRWRPTAATVAEVKTVQVTAYDAATTYRLTIGSIVISTIAAGSVNATATALAVAWNASTEGPPSEITASANTDTVTLTGDTAGVPYTVTSSVSGGTGTIGAVSTTTAATGPSFWAAANFDSGTLPADGDNVYFDHSDLDLKYNLDQSAIELALLQIDMSYTGNIGLPEVNEDGTEYREYRERYLIIGPVACHIGRGSGQGSGRLKINFGTDQTALTVHNTGSADDDDLPAVIVKGTHASNALIVRGASDVGVAVFGAEVATFATVSIEGSATVLFGSGVTLSGALTVNGGDVQFNSLIDSSLTVNGGSVVINGTANVDQLTIRGGTVNYNTTGTLGGATIVSGSGVLDFTDHPSTLTVTNPIDVYQGGTVIDPQKSTGNVVIDFNEGSDYRESDLGQHVRLTRGTPA